MGAVCEEEEESCSGLVALEEEKYCGLLLWRVCGLLLWGVFVGWCCGGTGRWRVCWSLGWRRRNGKGLLAVRFGEGRVGAVVVVGSTEKGGRGDGLFGGKLFGDFIEKKKWR